MAYIEPSVIIYQEILSTTPPMIYPDMYACIVGPAYDVITKQVLGQTEGNDTYNFVLSPTRILDINSIKVTLNAYIKVTTYNTGSSLAGKSIVTVDSTTANLAKIGMDVFVGNFQTKITYIDGNKLYLKDAVSEDNTNTSITLTDYVEDYIPNQVTYNSSTNTITVVDNKVVNGTAYISYRALKTDLSGSVNSITTIKEIEGQIGVIDPVQNPLAYALYKALQNTIVPVKYYAISEDTPKGYAEALNYIGEDDQIYAVVPLTKDMGVLTSYKTWAEQMSAPEVKKYKIVLGNIDLPTQETIVDEITESNVTLTNKGNGLFELSYDDGKFLDSGVVPGDIYVTNTGVKYKVVQVLNNTNLLVEAING